jgi:hypothetical protein
VLGGEMVAVVRGRRHPAERHDEGDQKEPDGDERKQDHLRHM